MNEYENEHFDVLAPGGEDEGMGVERATKEGLYVARTIQQHRSPASNCIRNMT
jgi:hypothetical protein